MSYQTDAGLWCQRIGHRTYSGRPALFLDRDGVVVEEVHFLSRIEDIRIIDGVAAAIVQAKARDMAVVIVTNQSGVARGHFGWDTFATVQNEILSLLGSAGAEIDLVLACGYHPDGKGELARDHDWRKPHGGMLREAARILEVSLKDSIIVGDRFTDLSAGKAAGLREGTLVETGYGAGELQKRGDLAETWAKEDQFRLYNSPTAAVAINEWLART